jgi:alanine dehydrogenase
MYLYLTPNDFRAMPAYLGPAREAACGIKWVSVFPGNRALGIPTVNASILLSSPKTGETLAVIEANAITALRTAAAAAVATHYMANPKPGKLAIVGAGLQAAYQLSALAARYSFKEITVWGVTPQESARFVAARKSKWPQLRAASTVKECVKSADIVVTCTPSRKPLVKSEWIPDGCHINAIGADAKGKQELETALTRRGKVVVDDWEQASHSGEINVPVSKGVFKKGHLRADLGQLAARHARGRRSAREVTIFDSTGLAILDIFFAKYVYDKRPSAH